MIRFLTFFTTLFILSNPVAAQFTGGGSSSGGNSGGAFGIQEQGDNVTDTFAGLTFQVQRLVRDPSTTNAYRLILRVIETEKTGRRVAMVQPAATLIDEFGNVYYVANSTGVPICTRPNKAWDLDTSNCAYYLKDTPVTLTPSQPTPVVLTLLPYDGAFSAELAQIASTASLSARFAIYSRDLQTQQFYDVVINGIELPQGNS
ncbi:hypothetical protein [Roseobacter sp. S98]|uniref:hypothetical protein n=1 Tax=Roseobacter algicola (ex Choi et al. 2025) (nom. illeg.) TaxID=3092138 RepID=UPI0035C69BD0